MLIRKKYLKKISPFYDETSLIKIIYGLRRSGKSVILTQIVDELKKKGIPKDHIIYMNFESLDYLFLSDAKKMYDYFKGIVKDKKIYYLLLDEIGNVKDFEKGINSLRIMGNFSIFITGSNSRMTFLELSTDLSGRYVSFRVYPLSFKEVVELTNTKKEDYKKLLFDIFEWGSLPQRFSFENKDARLNYISDIYDSIVLKDVVERLNIKDVTTFNKIFQYLLETEGREFSPSNVLNYMKENYREIGTDTLYNYLEALCSTFIINKVNRYDIVGKNVLKTLNKYYVSDLGIKKIKTSNKELNYSICLENLVYNDLISKGYEVYVGKTKKGEVDFLVFKNNERKYIQVCYQLTDEKTFEREFNALLEINDNYEKYIISTDEENYSRDGIIHMNIFDFLMKDDF